MWKVVTARDMCLKIYLAVFREAGNAMNAIQAWPCWICTPTLWVISPIVIFVFKQEVESFIVPDMSKHKQPALQYLIQSW